MNMSNTKYQICFIQQIAFLEMTYLCSFVRWLAPQPLPWETRVRA
uniref:Uncharacterized protein n=1 Tax=Anguilla anguilla TaxID=7936 RepID=A0A0E9R1G8_ANGAN